MSATNGVGEAGANYVIKRRKGRLVDILAIAERFAIEEGVDLDRELGAMFVRLIQGAGPDNTRAAKLVLQYVAQDAERLRRIAAPLAPQVTPEMRALGTAPSLPTAEELAEAVDDLTDAMEREQRVLRLVRPPPKTVEDLLQ